MERNLIINISDFIDAAVKAEENRPFIHTEFHEWQPNVKSEADGLLLKLCATSESIELLDKHKPTPAVILEIEASDYIGSNGSLDPLTEPAPEYAASIIIQSEIFPNNYRREAISHRIGDFDLPDTAIKALTEKWRNIRHSIKERMVDRAQWERDKERRNYRLHSALHSALDVANEHIDDFNATLSEQE